MRPAVRRGGSAAESRAEEEGLGMSLRLGFIGCGAVAGALGPAWAAAGHPVVAVASRHRTSARALAERLPGCRAVDGPQAVADATDLVFLTVPDDAVASVAASVLWGRTAAVHCSAGLPVAALGAQRSGGLHPLQSFPARAAAAPRLDVPFAVEASEAELHETLVALARAVGGRPFELRPEDRALYHAAAALACGGATAVVSLAARLWPGVDFAPLARAGVDNAAAGSATGPVARGDAAMVRRHLAALGAADPLARDAYRTQGRALRPSAEVAAALVEDASLATVLRGKLHRATVTQADPDYVGSITLDAALLEAAGIAVGEQVHVLDVDNGARVVTYAIQGERGSGVVGINGAAARCIGVGDRVIVLTYVQVPFHLRTAVQARVVLLDAANRPRGVSQ
jgi:L-aspartate-alpha-decarboxylase